MAERERPRTHICRVEGCRQYGVPQVTPESEPAPPDTHEQGSHYMRYHHDDFQAAYAAKVAKDHARRAAHFAQHGVWPPPQV